MIILNKVKVSKKSVIPTKVGMTDFFRFLDCGKTKGCLLILKNPFAE
jgi:hypothetical protein